jgi:hypothetical protein
VLPRAHVENVAAGGLNTTMTRPLIEDCIHLDLGALVRDGTIVPGRHSAGTIRWRVGASVDYEAHLAGGDGWIVLSYLLGYPARPVRQWIGITSVPIARGGYRRYFVLEGRRASQLYQAPGTAFLPRVALGLSYRCQRLGTRKRCAQRAERIKRELGFFGANGVRPTGMRTRRWVRLRERLRELTGSAGLHGSGIST